HDPSAGGAFHFYDEVHALVGDIPAGGSVRLQKDTTNKATFYVIDLVDLEQVAPPLLKPAGYLDLAQDCGATPDDGTDDSQKIQDCVNLAHTQSMGLWIPKGTFDLPTQI